MQDRCSYRTEVMYTYVACMYACMCLCMDVFVHCMNSTPAKVASQVCRSLYCAVLILMSCKPCTPSCLPIQLCGNPVGPGLLHHRPPLAPSHSLNASSSEAQIVELDRKELCKDDADAASACCHHDFAFWDSTAKKRHSYIWTNSSSKIEKRHTSCTQYGSGRSGPIPLVQSGAEASMYERS